MIQRYGVMMVWMGAMLFGNPSLHHEFTPHDTNNTLGVRSVIHLPTRVDESSYEVEIFVGKPMYLDSCNRYRLKGDIAQQDGAIVVSHIGALEALSHKVCHGGKRDRFVSLFRSEELFRAYESERAIVIYHPRWYEVRYRILKQAQQTQKAIVR